MKAVVITPTTGIPELAQAIQSVAKQGDQVQHWVVIDGMQYADRAIKIVQENVHNNLKLIILPENTGAPKYHFQGDDLRFFGHRVYSGMIGFINTEYVLFLDEDNWFDDGHVSSMVNAIANYNLDWCYSLRKVVNKDGSYMCDDNCDSLGIFPNQNNVSFVDMNCYCFKTEFALKLVSTLYSSNFNADREVFKQAVALCQKPDGYGCTGKYSVNYRANREQQYDWFMGGNEKIKSIYKTFPWRVE